MTHQIFIEIKKFDEWAQKQSNIPQGDRGGEWECDYNEWDEIGKAFENFINDTDSEKWTNDEKQRLLYIIARDNEMESLSKMLSANEKALIILTRESILSGNRDDKWQLAVQLYKLTDKNLAIELLDHFVNDDEEYVNRRALMELAKLQSHKIEFYCESFWNRKKYDKDDEEYQRLAVLHSLKTINSNHLNRYIQMAKEDGRKYLVERAAELEKK